MILKKCFGYILFVVVALALTGCYKTNSMIGSIDDLNGARIASLDRTVSDQTIAKLFPKSDITHFKTSPEFLLALAIGKCDAGITERQKGEHLLSKNPDYGEIVSDEAINDSVIVIVHRSNIVGGYRDASKGDILDKSLRRVHRSIISDGYWLLILKGFAATIAIFLLGIILAFALSISLVWMNNDRRFRFISGPIVYFIKTVHDVPSIVLIFFFYYIVFASVCINVIVVCAISLGVYTSGTLMGAFNTHLKQVDPNQHAAAEMLGLTGWKKYRYVILPQAVKPMLPQIISAAKTHLRATSYVGYISGIDLVKVTEIIRNQTYDILVPLLLVSVIFLLLSNLIGKSLSLLYNKMFLYD